MNKISVFSKDSDYNCFQACSETIKDALSVAVGVLAAVVFAVAHPIIGPVGSLACLLTAAYHGVLLNYHWRHSREKDDKGNLIPGTELNQLETKNEKNYMNRDAQFKSSDLIRLQNEVQRLYHLKEAEDSLKWARGLAKCAIPVAGPIWAFFSELRMGGSMEINCCGCRDDWHHLTPEEMLERQIAQLKSKSVV